MSTTQSFVCTLLGIRLQLAQAFQLSRRQCTDSIHIPKSKINSISISRWAPRRASSARSSVYAYSYTPTYFKISEKRCWFKCWKRCFLAFSLHQNDVIGKHWRWKHFEIPGLLSNHFDFVVWPPLYSKYIQNAFKILWNKLCSCMPCWWRKNLCIINLWHESKNVPYVVVVVPYVVICTVGRIQIWHHHGSVLHDHALEVWEQ